MFVGRVTVGLVPAEPRRMQQSTLRFQSAGKPEPCLSDVQNFLLSFLFFSCHYTIGASKG